MSELVDHFAQPYIPTIPSFIRDTQDFLNKRYAFCLLPVDSMLFTFDVAAVCPSILHDDGLASFCNAILENLMQTLTISSICHMTELVLRCNVIEFIKEYPIQTSGTAIETN